MVHKASDETSKVKEGQRKRRELDTDMDRDKSKQSCETNQSIDPGEAASQERVALSGPAPCIR